MNLVDLVRYWAQWRKEHPSIIFGDEVQTWEHVDAVTDALARGLAANGVRKGDRVGALMMNRPELAHLAIATLKLGAICVPLNFRLTATEILPLLVDADCRVVVTEDKLTPLLEPAARELGFTIFATETTDHRSYDALLQPGPVPIVDIDDDDGAFICYTSGTTGVQKGALLTHRSVIWPAMAKVLAEGLTGNDRQLVAVPLVFTGAMISCFMQLTVYTGAAMVLEADFDPDRYLAMIEKHRISALTTVPVIWERMVQSPDFAKADVSSLKSAAVGGAPVRLDLIDAFRARGVPLIQVYGLTEASGLAANLRPEDAKDHPGFAGRAILGTRLRIVDDHGVTVPTGEIGEIAVAGPHVMKGYWNKPEATAQTIVDGWLRTGDQGLQDEHGFLKVVDRTKDMLISGGINVYPAEIEKALTGIEGVIDLAVIGVADETWGEIPMIVLHASRDADAILAEVERIGNRDLAGFKRPKFAVVMDQPLPRTFSGKLAKPVLRKQYPTPPQDAKRLFGK